MALTHVPRAYPASAAATWAALIVGVIVLATPAAADGGICVSPTRTPDPGMSRAPTWFGEISEATNTRFHAISVPTAPKCTFTDMSFSEDLLSGDVLKKDVTLHGYFGGKDTTHLTLQETINMFMFGEGADPNSPDNLKWRHLMTKSRLGDGTVVRSAMSTAKDKGSNCLADANPGTIAVGDYNGDGLVDVLAPRHRQTPLLFRNLGDGMFEEVAESVGLYFSQGRNPEDPPEKMVQFWSGAVFVDVDNDGDQDIFVSTFGAYRHYLFINRDGFFHEEALMRGDARVTLPGDTSMTSGGPLAVADYDDDGWLDIYVCEWRLTATRDILNFGEGLLSNSRLLRNRGAEGPEFAGVFEDATDKAGVNLEMHAREYMTKGHGMRGVNRMEEKITAQVTKQMKQNSAIPVPKRKLRARTRRRSVPAGVYSFGTLFRDLDNDGHLDLVMAGDFDTSALFWNNGDGTFTEGSRDAGFGLDQNGMGLTVADIDRDGLLDIYVTAIYSDGELDHTTPFGIRGNVLYHNEGNRKFTDHSRIVDVHKGHWGWGTALFDIDHDGDNDLWATNGMVIPESTTDDKFNVQPDRLWLNPLLAADGTFAHAHATTNWTDVAPEYGVDDTTEARGLALVDIDHDGDIDVLRVSHGGGPSRMFRNDGADTSANSWLRVMAFENEARGKREALNTRVYVEPTSGPRYGPGDVHMGVVGSVPGFDGQSESAAHFGLGQVADTDTFTVTVKFRAPEQTVTVRNVKPNQWLDVYRPADGADSSASAPSTPCADAPALKPLKELEHKSIHDDEKWVPPPEPRRLLEVAQRTLNPWMIEVARRATVDAKVWAIVHERPSYSYDGSGNNLAHPTWGQSMTAIPRHGPVGYDDGVVAPRGMLALEGKHLPSARAVSNALFAQDGDVLCQRGMTDLSVHFGQLLAHDTDHTTPQTNAIAGSYFPIPVPVGDPYFDPNGTGEAVVRMRRSIFDINTGTGTDNPRAQINKVTSFVDASSVYGSDSGRNEALRTRKYGRLTQVVDGTVPGLNVKGLGNDNPLAKGIGDLVAAGDARANIQPGLLAMHTLFVREHNTLAELIQSVSNEEIRRAMAKGLAAAVAHDRWDQVVFELARRMVIAEFQAITYEEYLPALLGPDAIPAYRGYNPDLNPTVLNEFSSAAFRVGHSQANDDFVLRYADGTERVLGLNESYFKTKELISGKEGGIDPILRGMINRPAQAADTKAIDGLRNFLFGPIGDGGVDLIATNIQRGRDHGVADYNSVRESYGLPRKASFDAVTGGDTAKAAILADLYPGGVDTLDLLVGGLSEPRAPQAAVGETFQKIIADQFIRLRDGDRMFYENLDKSGNAFLPELIPKIKKTRFNDLLLRNVYFDEEERARIRGIANLMLVNGKGNN